MSIRKLGFLITMVLIAIACEEVINVPDIGSEQVNILAPAEGTTVSDGDISFNWETVNGADSYRLQIATPNFTSASQIVLDSSVTSNSFVKTLTANVYEWRLKAVNSAFETIYSNANFTVVTDIANESVVLTAPENNTTVTTGTITFEWEAVAGAQGYTFQIASPDFSDVNNIIEDVEQSEVTSLKALEAGAYRWRVKAVNDLTETAYTEYNLTVEE